MCGAVLVWSGGSLGFVSWLGWVFPFLGWFLFVLFCLVLCCFVFLYQDRIFFESLIDEARVLMRCENRNSVAAIVEPRTFPMHSLLPGWL